MASPEVDHVLPWSFVLEDRTWNLVLACRKCNNEKRDRLTNVVALEKLCARNKAIADGRIDADRFFRRDFAECHTRDLIVYLSDALREQSAKIDVFSAPAMTPFRSIELGGTIL